MGVTQCFLRSAPAFGKDVLSPTLFNYIIDWILRQALQDYPGVQVGADVHVSDLAYADNIVMLSSSYSEMQGLLEAVNRQAAADQGDVGNHVLESRKIPRTVHFCYGFH